MSARFGLCGWNPQIQPDTLLHPAQLHNPSAFVLLPLVEQPGVKLSQRVVGMIGRRVEAKNVILV
jgi:hypothetical protein